MLAIVSLVRAIASVVVNALVAYDETPAGHADIENLLALVENAGFDIPGWEPDQPNMNVAVEGVDVAAAVDDIAKRWLERHPQRGGQ